MAATRRPDPAARLRRALLAATWVCAGLELAWVALWLWLTAHVADLTVLRSLPVVGYLAMGPLAAIAAALCAGRRPRLAGPVLTAGGLGSAGVIWLGHVPSHGAPEALWCTAVAMVAVGAGWLALESSPRR